MIADYDGDISNLFNVNIEGELPILATRNMAMFPGVITPLEENKVLICSTIYARLRMRALPCSASTTRKLSTQTPKTSLSMECTHAS